MDTEMNDGYDGYLEATGLKKLKRKATSNLKKRSSVAKKAIKKKTGSPTKPAGAVKPKQVAAPVRPKQALPAKPIKKPGMSMAAKIGIGAGILLAITAISVIIYKVVKK